MLPFRVPFKTGRPVYEQVAYAAKKAIVSRLLLPGDRFPSVRQLSQELRINPNTAQKVISALVEERLIEVQPGIGTVVAKVPTFSHADRRDWLGSEVERLVVEAMGLSLDLADLQEALSRTWTKLNKI